MADEAQTIRAINWREVFPFTNIFRAFRIAVHPSKLMLGLAALLILYSGGRIMDAIWPASSSSIHREMEGYEKYAAQHSTASFADGVEAQRQENQRAYAAELMSHKVYEKQDDATLAAKTFSHAGDLKARFNQERDSAVDDAKKTYDTSKTAREKDLETAKAKPDGADRDKAVNEAEKSLRDARETYESAIAAADADVTRKLAGLRQIRPRGIFDTFFEYEVVQVNTVVEGAIAFKWADVVFPAIKNFVMTGPGWMMRYHPLYFVLFAVLFLLVWAVFGGAIARIAAVHVARDEKISVRQALKFSTNKLLSFIFAPLIPLIIILGIGALLAAGGLLFYIPWIGPIVAGALFFLALIAAVVITLVVFGTLGGFNLMYPTVAVEGSDSFDAISRSFSYVFARPWRMAFYTVVALLYGALTYLFVRYFVYLVLWASQFFVGWWLGGQPGRWYPQMFPPPNSDRLPYEVSFSALKWSEWTAAVLISFWNYLLISLVGAFAISYYFSVNTIIYYLMRREVDATELDDVYVEDADDDFATDTPKPFTATSTPTAATISPLGDTSAPGGGISGTAGSITTGEPLSGPYTPPATDAPPAGEGQPFPQA